MVRLSAQNSGPFVAEQLRSGDPYELSNGHPIQCAPTGRRGSTRNLTGGAALETDPIVRSAGVDLGISTEPGMLRAPDIAVGTIEDQPGWARQAPPLAVEYADVGQDEVALRAKIDELLAAGTKHIWVVRLGGERRVEVYEPAKRMRQVTGAGVLEAPGILQNAVPLDVLYDREAAHEATLRNLLQRKGYRDLSAVMETSRSEGLSAGLSEGLSAGRTEGLLAGRTEGQLTALRQSILTILEARGLEVAPVRDRIEGECDSQVLGRWLHKAATVSAAASIFD